ncbi:hypothetical protein SKAU_G00004090 [Synaphobranchus kaupii]|uniref:Uncharacterized protein n=1 Tax=Synaphobranchus kaupii TaxID=118154 RepID=A0A9Q1JAK1_SYNKA|nr:hypothetical protein SKAU_G00004090 [Synaphobranchus kaupii]
MGEGTDEGNRAPRPAWRNTSAERQRGPAANWVAANRFTPFDLSRHASGLYCRKPRMLFQTLFAFDLLPQLEREGRGRILRLLVSMSAQAKSGHGKQPGRFKPRGGKENYS